jgi:branched-chain amino acid transport system ATP-binding protein
MTVLRSQKEDSATSFAPLLELDQVTGGYGDHTVLRNVSITVPKGSVTALIGPNGAGKSTLLKTISGLIPSSSGVIRLNGEEITKMRPDRRARLGLCHIPEGRAIYRSLSVRENLVMQSPKGREAASVERVTSAFPVLGARLAQRAGTLSGGEQQMLAMGAAYARDPSLILVDEASLGLAPLVIDVIFEFLRDVTSEGTALLLVDQYAARILDMASRAYVLVRGSIVFEGDPAQLLAGNVFERYMGAG